MLLKKMFAIGMVLYGSLGAVSGQSVPIRYFNKSPIKEEAVRVNEFIEDFGDSTVSNSLYQRISAEGLPVSYFREIKTSICFDGKCRLLDILVYWTPIGGYMGFELPLGEFLSKTDHDPFSEKEYLKLHAILSDSLSPLADYSFDELVPGTGNPSEVDAVSSATLRDIVDYIVPGAAYTTYRLWHMVYGKTKEVTSHLSDSLYTEKFALALIESNQPSSQIWALQRLSKLPDISPHLLVRVLDLTKNSNLNIASTALSSLAGVCLDNFEVQKVLLQHVSEGEYALKKPAMLKLGEAKALHDSVRNGLSELVSNLNGDLLGELLNVYLKHEVSDAVTLRKISEVLESGNRYKAGKAFAFLEKSQSADEVVKKRMMEYRRLK